MDNHSNNEQQSRRRFLIKSSTTAAAGALFTLLPTKSVWATGLGNSLTASGHGSDFNSGMTLIVQKEGFFITENVTELSQEFRMIFGIEPFSSGSPGIAVDATLGHVLNGDFGPNNINLNMSLIYLNAVYSASKGMIEYPILRTENPRGPFINAMALADHLANEATMNTMGTAIALQSVIDNPNQII